jgi:hypothetical protein
VAIEGVKVAAEAGLVIAQQGVDPAELRQIFGVFASGDDGPLAASGCGHARKQPA